MIAPSHNSGPERELVCYPTGHLGHRLTKPHVIPWYRSLRGRPIPNLYIVSFFLYARNLSKYLLQSAVIWLIFILL